MKRSGQTLVEFVAGVFILVAATTAVARLLGAEWHRANCAYVVFEVARARLEGRSREAQVLWAWWEGARVRIEEDSTRVRAIGRCDGLEESVTLYHLEHQP